MISVVIPVLDEAPTIASVVAFALRDPSVAEVIVVDDGSTDGTPELARAAGAIVVTSTLLGKGASMEDGVWAARGDVLLFLDGDLSEMHEDLVRLMTRPVVEGKADFVKARFSRGAGRVTLLTARPLLRVFFPELAHFEQPLGGIVAARHSLLRRLRFENDYGVDVGLLLDASASGARLAEVDIGHIEHDSSPLAALGKMADQVVRTLLDRAARYGRLRPGQLREIETREVPVADAFAVARRRAGKVERLALFDMDGVLLDGRFVLALARRTGKEVGLSGLLDHPRFHAEERTRRIAELFAGVPQQVFEELARDMPLIPGAIDTILALRRAGYVVGMVTDSYSVAAEVVRRRVFADFVVAHHLAFRRGKATGEITLSEAMTHEMGCGEHRYCKVNVMRHLEEILGLGAERFLAVGDGENDVCLLGAAGTSVAFRPSTPRVREAAGHVVLGELTEILGVVQAQAEESEACRSRHSA